MSFTLNAAPEIKERFLFLATNLHAQFPALDLRFNMAGDSTCLRFVAAAVCPDIVEIDLAEASPEELLYAAVFQVKEIAQLFDA